MKTIIKTIACGGLLLVSEILSSQNVAINASGASPNASAMLDIASGSSFNKGLLIPRVTAAQKAAMNPLPAVAQGLMVYQTDGLEGIYYNTSLTTTPLWSFLTAGGWSLTGNAGTVAGTNFIGTTDAVDWVIKTTNTERMRVLSTGNVGIGIAAPLQRLDVQGGNARINIAFIGDVGHGINWAGFSHYLQATTTGYALLASSDGNYTLVNKENTGLGYIGFRIGNTDKAVITNAGDMGIGTTTPAYRLDNVGSGGGNINLRTTGRIWTNSASGGIWLSDLTDCFMGNISASQLGFWTSTVGWNAFNITKTNGYIGVGTSTPVTRFHVLSDENNLPVIYGINSNTTAGTSSYGVRGECSSTGLGSAGVSGVSTNSSSNEMGVLGDYSLWGAGVFGLGWAGAYTDMPTTRDFGMFGTVNYFTGTGVYGKNSNLTVGSAYGVYCSGNFAVTGAKSSSVPTTKGNQLVYCQESPEMWFEDIGHSKLMNGLATVNLDELFMETVLIDAAHPMEVFVQENGECSGLYVVKENDKFIVKEKNGGHSNIEFSYRVLAKRRFYQDQRFGVDANQDFGNNLSKAHNIEPTTTDPAKMKELVDRSIAEKEATKKK